MKMENLLQITYFQSQMLDVLTKTGRYNAALFTLPTAKITAMLPL
jgi:hypothetical protein